MLFCQELPPEVREAQEKKLDGLKKQQEIHTRLALERKIFLRDRKIKFFGKFFSFFLVVYLGKSNTARKIQFNKWNGMILQEEIEFLQMILSEQGLNTWIV